MYLIILYIYSKTVLALFDKIVLIIILLIYSNYVFIKLNTIIKITIHSFVSAIFCVPALFCRLILHFNKNN